MATGALTGLAIALKRSRRLGLDTDALHRICLWVVLWGFVGARIGHVFLYHWADYKDDLPSILRLWEGGLSSFGGFVGSTVATVVLMRRSRLHFWTYADVICYGFATGWAIGRLGCYVIHDHPGRLAGSAWYEALATEMDVRLLNGDWSRDVRHDLGLYDGILSAVIAMFYLIADRKPRAPGFFIGWLCVLYCVPRFFLDYLRATDLVASDTRYLGLTPAQYGAILIAGLGGAILWHSNSGRTKLSPTAGS